MFSQGKADRSDVISVDSVGAQVNQRHIRVVIASVPVVLRVDYDPVRTNDLFSTSFNFVSVQFTKAYFDVSN